MRTRKVRLKILHGFRSEQGAKDSVTLRSGPKQRFDSLEALLQSSRVISAALTVQRRSSSPRPKGSGTRSTLAPAPSADPEQVDREAWVDTPNEGLPKRPTNASRFGTHGKRHLYLQRVLVSRLDRG